MGVGDIDCSGIVTGHNSVTHTYTAWGPYPHQSYDKTACMPTFQELAQAVEPRPKPA